MKYQHYAPGARVTMVEGALWEFWQYVEQHRDGSTAVLAFEEDRPFFDLPFFRYGHENDPDSQAEELFDALRAIDEAGVQTVYARMPAMDGVGLAVYNRLLRACAFSVVHLKPTMRVLGVTGPTGSGKGLVSAEAKRCGLGVVDCDRIAHELHRDPTVCQALAEAFGSQVLQEDGTVNRPALAKAAFASEDAHRRLNERMLPAILRRTLRALQDYARDGLPAVLLDAPTLLESGFAPICHQVAAVLAPQEVRLARIIARDGITEEAAVARMSVQPPEEYYRSHADVVLENNRSCEAFLKKAGDWLHDAAEAKKEG